MVNSANAREVQIPVGRRIVEGLLVIPRAAQGAVIFAHGSGSGRHSPRNQYVARVLQEAGLATLLLDLLEEEEAEDREKVFDIALLAERLQDAADWLRSDPAPQSLSLGYFGASTGAGAALVAAENRGSVRRPRTRLAAADLPGALLRPGRELQCRPPEVP